MGEPPRAIRHRSRYQCSCCRKDDARPRAGRRPPQRVSIRREAAPRLERSGFRPHQRRGADLSRPLQNTLLVLPRSVTAGGRWLPPAARRVTTHRPTERRTRAEAPQREPPGGMTARAGPRRTAGTTAELQVPLSGTRGVAAVPPEADSLRSECLRKLSVMARARYDEPSSTAIGTLGVALPSVGPSRNRRNVGTNR